MRPLVRLLTALASAGAARAVLAVLTRSQPLGRDTWDRTNHAGRTVTLLEGPAWALGAATGLALTGGPLTGAATVLGAAALGAVDDHVGSTTVKGLRGHLGALRRGQVTTGAVKIGGLAAVGLGTAAALDHDRPLTPARLATTLTGGAVVAGAANLVNLFDLRPGRALKVVLLASPLGAGGSAQAARLASAAAGTSLALLPEDLAGESMLGDTGANAAGALLGAAICAGRGGPGRAGALAILAGLILASEKVSFTQVIARTPVLDRIDRWGRTT